LSANVDVMAQTR